MSIANKFFYALWLADSSDVGIEFNKKETQELVRMLEGYIARIAELETEVTKGHELQDSYCDRIAELEAFIEQLIERGDDLVLLAYDREYPDVIEWQNLVTEWKVQR